jgi:hypothetical protein
MQAETDGPNELECMLVMDSAHGYKVDITTHKNEKNKENVVMA